MSMDASRAILGTFGKLFIDGVWQTNINQVEANVENQKRELNLSGDDWIRHKRGSKKGTGTMTGYKITSDMIKRGFSKFQILLQLDDPEAYGHENIRLDFAMVDRVQLANFRAGEEVMEETPFTFEGYELLDPIVAY